MVDNFEETVSNLVEELGVGPFKCWEFAEPVLYDTTFRGQPAKWTMKLGLTWLGDVQWEVIQPVDGPSLYREHLDKHGRGVQHLLMSTGDMPFHEAARRLSVSGHPFSQTARINSPVQLGAVTVPALPRLLAAPTSLEFGYIDADATLRTGIELTKYPLGLSERLSLRAARPQFCVPAGESNFERKLGSLQLRRIVKISIVARDLSHALRSWVGVTGVRPWKVFDRSTAKVAWALLDKILLEIVEPRESGVHQELLDTRGEGVAAIGVEPLRAYTDLVAHCDALGYERPDYRPPAGDLESSYFLARASLGTDIEVIDTRGQRISAAFDRALPDSVTR